MYFYFLELYIRLKVEGRVINASKYNFLGYVVYRNVLPYDVPKVTAHETDLII
jgi:hypothetical protein